MESVDGAGPRTLRVFEIS